MADGWTFEGRPLRKVVSFAPGAGRGGLLGGDTSRRKFWWEMTLECGHHAQRDMRYRPLRDDEMPIYGGRTGRPFSDRLPPPTRVRCDDCPQAGTA